MAKHLTHEERKLTVIPDREDSSALKNISRLKIEVDKDFHLTIHREADGSICINKQHYSESSTLHIECGSSNQIYIR